MIWIRENTRYNRVYYISEKATMWKAVDLIFHEIALQLPRGLPRRPSRDFERNSTNFPSWSIQGVTRIWYPYFLDPTRVWKSCIRGRHPPPWKVQMVSYLKPIGMFDRELGLYHYEMLIIIILFVIECFYMYNKLTNYSILFFKNISLCTLLSANDSNKYFLMY